MKLDVCTCDREIKDAFKTEIAILGCHIRPPLARQWLDDLTVSYCEKCHMPGILQFVFTMSYKKPLNTTRILVDASFVPTWTRRAVCSSGSSTLKWTCCT